MSDHNELNAGTSDSEERKDPALRLRLARESSGLSQKEVANHLRLSVEKIEFLERGEVDQLAAPVFVAGYLRAYAKLVGLPEDEIIAEFQALASMDTPSIDPSSSPASNDYGTVGGKGLIKNVRSGEIIKSKGVIWGVLGVVIVVIVYVFAFDSREDKNINNALPDQEQKISGKDGQGDPSSVVEQAPDKLHEPTKNTVNKDNNIQIEGKSQSDKSAMEGSNNQIVEENLNESKLSFYFNDESWVEVNDAQGDRLLYRLGKKGASATVTGLAPFEVQLGYVPGVEIEFNGKPYDLSRFANRRSARFNIGKTGDPINNDG